MVSLGPLNPGWSPSYGRVSSSALRPSPPLSNAITRDVRYEHAIGNNPAFSLNSHTELCIGYVIAIRLGRAATGIRLLKVKIMTIERAEPTLPVLNDVISFRILEEIRLSLPHPGHAWFSEPLGAGQCDGDLQTLGFNLRKGGVVSMHRSEFNHRWNNTSQTSQGDTWYTHKVQSQREGSSLRHIAYMRSDVEFQRKFVMYPSNAIMLGSKPVDHKIGSHHPEYYWSTCDRIKGSTSNEKCIGDAADILVSINGQNVEYMDKEEVHYIWRQFSMNSLELEFKSYEEEIDKLDYILSSPERKFVTHSWNAEWLILSPWDIVDKFAGSVPENCEIEIGDILVSINGRSGMDEGAVKRIWTQLVKDRCDMELEFKSCEEIVYPIKGERPALASSSSQDQSKDPSTDEEGACPNKGTQTR